MDNLYDYKKYAVLYVDDERGNRVEMVKRSDNRKNTELTH